jgi:hypothetical protein
VKRQTTIVKNKREDVDLRKYLTRKRRLFSIKKISLVLASSALAVPSLAIADGFKWPGPPDNSAWFRDYQAGEVAHSKHLTELEEKYWLTELAPKI